LYPITNGDIKIIQESRAGLPAEGPESSGYPHARGEIEMAYVIAEPCIGTKDTACVDVCPVDCIHPRKDEAGFEAETQLYIHPDECIDCGACVPVCPVTAIFALEDLPEKWTSFTPVNADWFKNKKA
jgi:NAD-dependent dihydropyrimidine dehydrogenase PreA subunit